MEPFTKALKYLENRKFEKSLQIFKKLSKQFDYKEIWINLGNCYKGLDQDALAFECYKKSNDKLIPFTDNRFIHTDYHCALNNIGLYYYTIHNDILAEEYYRKAIAMDSNYIDAKWNLSQTLLRQYCSNKLTDPREGWTNYDFRLTREGGVTLKNKKEKLKVWNGIDRVDSLVVLIEQGFGDTIMFARYLKLINVKKLWIQCDPRLDKLFSEFNICRDPIETDATHGIPMCSLGRIFNPVIPPGDWLKEKYVKKSNDGVLDIGVAWSGSTTHANDRNRSTSAGRFRNLSSYGNLYTINPSEAGERGFKHLETSDWGDTVAQLSKLDLVITVDTSIVHLCGSLGMECWMLQPLKETDFRWGDSSMGENNLWYPSVKIIRNPGNWDSVFETVRKKLDALKCSN